MLIGERKIRNWITESVKKYFLKEFFPAKLGTNEKRNELKIVCFLLFPNESSQIVCDKKIVSCLRYRGREKLLFK